jgi:transcriptional regulator with GAF, ATPase, and Fis domain
MTEQYGFLVRAGQGLNHAQKWALAEFNTLGADPSNTIPILGLAERHARIEWRNDAAVLRDQRTGTVKINGVSVMEAPLSEGDEITLGDMICEFRLAEHDLASLPASLNLKSSNEDWNQQLLCLPQVGRSEQPVLFLGQSGTGKERLARAVHELSARHDGPYVTINCSALSESLIESELFGHVRGSFTGATNDRKGAFEAARGGTLFLDEIGDFPMHLQPKLLRALENQEIRPVGSDRAIETDVRIVAATHQNLSQKVARGEFRADLFYRLHVVTIQVPCLKERWEDFDAILFELAREHRVRFSLEAILQLKKHTWPGNLRELKNTVARGSALYGKENITAPMATRLVDVIATQPSPFESMVNSDGRIPVVKEIERDLIVRRLIANSGNQRQTAKDLGMPKSTLHDRLKIYNIDLVDVVKNGAQFTVNELGKLQQN